MALTVPAVPPQPPDPVLLSSGRPIRAGGAGDHGRIYNLITTNNLCLAAGGAQPVINQAFADQQAYGLTSMSFTERCRWRIPYLSERHVTLHCVVLARDTAGAPKIRFEADNGGDTVDASPAGGAWGRYEVDLDLTGGFGPHGGEYYEDVIMLTEGDLDIRIVQAWYVEATDGATYPAADTLADDPFEDGNLGTSVPLDTDLAVDDEALPSWLAHRLRRNIVNLSARPQVLFSTSALTGPALADGGEFVPWYPHRFTIPVPHLAADADFQIIVWARIQNDAGTDWLAYFDRGDGGIRDLLDSWNAVAVAPTIATITAPATSGTTWIKTTITVRPSPRVRAPLQYAGLAHIGFHCQQPVTTTSGIKSITAWGVYA